MPVRRLLLSSALALAACGAAHAMSTRWQCTGYKPLTLDVTPQVAHVHFDDDDWTLHRVRDAREARYVDARRGVAIVTRGRSLTLLRGGTRLHCMMLSDALDGPVAAPAPASGAAPAR